MTAGWRNGSSGARVHGGSRIVPPPARRRGALGSDGGTAAPGGSPAVPSDPGRVASDVMLTSVTVGERTDGTGGFVTGS